MNEKLGAVQTVISEYQRLTKEGNIGRVSLAIRRISAIIMILSWILCSWVGLREEIGIDISNTIPYPIPLIAEHIVGVSICWLIAETICPRIYAIIPSEELSLFIISLWRIFSLIYSALIFTFAVVALMRALAENHIYDNERLMAYISMGYLFLTLLFWQMSVSRKGFKKIDKKTGYHDLNGKIIFEGEYVVYKGMEYQVVKRTPYALTNDIKLDKKKDNRYYLFSFYHDEIINLQQAAADNEGHLKVLDKFL